MTQVGAPTDPGLSGVSPNVLKPGAASALTTPAGGGPLSADLGPAGPGDQGSEFNFASLLRTIKRRQGLFLFTFAVVTGALAANTLRERIFSPVYQGGFQIQVRNPFETRTGGSNQAEGTVGAIARSNYNADTNSLTVLLRSPLLIRPLAEQQGVGMNELIKRLRITPASTGSGRGAASTENVLDVTLDWPNPVQGRQILTELSKIYTRFSLTQRQEALDSGIKFLDRQAPEIQQRVDRLQGDMLRFRERNNNLDPSENAKAILATREGLLQQLRALQTQQVELNSRLASIASGRLQWSPSGAPTAVEQLGRQGIATPGRGAGAEVAAGAQTPLEQLNQFETDLAAARATYREDSPIVQSILARRNSLLPVVRRQAADDVRAQLLANVAQQDEINRQILLLNQNFRSNPQKMREFEDLQSRLNLAREHYTSYIQARENFRLELARSTTPWQVISPAEFADIPVEPNIQRSLLQALLIGLLAGVGAALIRERTDNVFHTPMDAERDLQLPVLGLIPFLPLEPGVEIASSIAKMSANERFAIKESLRSLFTTFRLLRADRNIRMVGVTSSTQGEGKSTAVTIFARTLADLGLKVLVIDADMRLPMQSRYVGVEQGEGLSSLLSDSTLRTSELIQTVTDNFDILPSGPKPPDPAKLLNSNRCQEVVDEVRNLAGYDMVLWDSPPCLMLADPILLGEKLDGILFLVGLGKVSRELAPQACRRIKATGVDVLGLICNQVNFPSRLNDYGYEYGYFYHYAYAGDYAKSRYGKYGRSLTGTIKRYRDSYLRRAGSGYGGDYISNRYLRDGYTVQSYQQAGSDSLEGGGPSGDSETSPSSRSEAAPSRHRRRRRTQLQRAVGWLRERLPLSAERRGNLNNRYRPYEGSESRDAASRNGGSQKGQQGNGRADNGDSGH